jgi:hypothetical protein
MMIYHEKVEEPIRIVWVTVSFYRVFLCGELEKVDRRSTNGLDCDSSVRRRTREAKEISCFMDCV